MSAANLELARKAYAALERGDRDEFLSLVDPDVEFRSLIAEAEGRTYKGHDGVREWWDTVAEALGGLHFQPQELHDVGDGVCAELLVVGHVEGVEVPQTMWQSARIREGRITWWGVFRSEAEALEALEAQG